jgi:hypothetical protein
MTWVIIIEEVLRIFGPILSELLQTWLKRHLTETAAVLDAKGTSPDRDSLFYAAIHTLPFFAVARQRLLYHMWKIPGNTDYIKTLAEQAE